MRTKIFVIAMTVACCALAIFGLSKRGTYTNITAEPDYLDSLYVGEIPKEFAAHQCSQMRQTLPESAYILRVKAVEPVDFCYGTGRQKVKILQVFKGSGIEPEEEIYITSVHWRILLYDDIPSAERGYVNFLLDDHEYLIFCETKVNSLDKQPTFEMLEEPALVPIFCYDDLENVILDTDEYGVRGTTYVPYSLVKGNEFFADSDEALQAILSLKKEMLAMYPRQ